MKQYRDFDNDPVRFNYSDGKAFLQRLHDQGQHYIPIVDAAIYHPNPDNESDAYQAFSDGSKFEPWLLNPDGSTYIGEVWPGYVGLAICYQRLPRTLMVLTSTDCLPRLVQELDSHLVDSTSPEISL